MALNRGSDVLAVDWQSQTHAKKIIVISHVWFFSGGEIPIKHSSLYNKI